MYHNLFFYRRLLFMKTIKFRFLVKVDFIIIFVGFRFFTCFFYNIFYIFIYSVLCSPFRATSSLLIARVIWVGISSFVAIVIAIWTLRSVIILTVRCCVVVVVVMTRVHWLSLSDLWSILGLVVLFSAVVMLLRRVLGWGTRSGFIVLLCVLFGRLFVLIVTSVLFSVSCRLQ